MRRTALAVCLAAFAGCGPDRPVSPTPAEPPAISLAAFKTRAPKSPTAVRVAVQFHAHLDDREDRFRVALGPALGDPLEVLQLEASRNDPQGKRLFDAVAAEGRVSAVLEIRTGEGGRLELVRVIKP